MRAQAQMIHLEASLHEAQEERVRDEDEAGGAAGRLHGFPRPVRSRQAEFISRQFYKEEDQCDEGPDC